MCSYPVPVRLSLLICRQYAVTDSGQCMKVHRTGWSAGLGLQQQNMDANVTPAI